VAKVTSKLQVTIPKRIAERLGIRPGDVLEFRTAGRGLWVVPASRRGAVLRQEERLLLFDRATARIEARAKADPLPPATERGWTRDDLYEDRRRSERDS
jgi:AbrB family looped-hinge helix DNA binding protein